MGIYELTPPARGFEHLMAINYLFKQKTSLLLIAMTFFMKLYFSKA
jgi:hypothetical protein